MNSQVWEVMELGTLAYVFLTPKFMLPIITVTYFVNIFCLKSVLYHYRLTANYQTQEENSQFMWCFHQYPTMILKFWV